MIMVFLERKKSLLFTLAGLSFLILVFLAGVSPACETPSDFNLAVYKIKDPEVLQALGTDTIPIRAASYSLPSATELPALELPILKLQEVTEQQNYAQLEGVFGQYADKKLFKKRVRDLMNLVTVKEKSKIFWINKASGAYSYSETKGIMAIPTTIQDHRQAVELALHYAVKQGLVNLVEHETLDVLFVSTVMNAMVEEGEQQPLTQYKSDYFVGLGRRYRGIPVVGSRLILRIGGGGNLFGVQKLWRPIIGEEENVSLKRFSLSDLGQKQPSEDALPQAALLADNDANNNVDIEVLGTAWGYIEGPVSNEQKMMGPGCLINYRRKEAGDPSDQASQKVLPLAEVTFPLLGTTKIFPPPEVSDKDQKLVKDKDDKYGDELN